MMATSSSTPANDDFHKLLLVVKDLAHQLDENRQATTKLKLHADLLKVFAPLPPFFYIGTYVLTWFAGTVANIQILRLQSKCTS
jgi:hypothetical protein